MIFTLIRGFFILLLTVVITYFFSFIDINFWVLVFLFDKNFSAFDCSGGFFYG